MSGGPARGEAALPLSHLVRQEAQRVLEEASLAADPARVAAGWERRFVVDGARAREVLQQYRELGFEVAADPLRPEALAAACADCRLLMLLDFRTIYTRRR